MKKSSKRALQMGAGALGAAALAAAAGMYLLSGKRGKANKAKIKHWTVKARHEVARQAKMAKRLSAAEYARLADKAVKKYGSLENLTAAQIMQGAKELKAEWKHIERHAKKMGMGKPAHKKSAARKSPRRKHSAKKRV